ncbi:MAG: tetratricopeptide repeat protein [bacterium]|nr:tetratricopeptide repeat protein [bacterium]
MKSTPFFLNAFALCLLILFAFGLAGCQSQQIDPFKQSVRQALDHYYQGENLERQRDFAGAAAEYQKSIEISPRPMAYYRLAMVSMALGDFQAGRANLEKALQLSPSFDEARKRIAMIDQRQSQDVVNPDSPWAPRPGSEAETQIIQPNPDAPAASPLITPQTIQPKPIQPQLSDEAQQTLKDARAATQAGNWQQAIAGYQTLLEQDADNANWNYNLGFALYQSGQVEQAIERYEKAADLDPRNAALWNDLGVAYERAGKSKIALDAYQKSIEIGSDGSAYYNLAVLMEKQGEYKQAIDLYEKYLAGNPDSEYAEKAKAQMDKLRRYVY